MAAAPLPAPLDYSHHHSLHSRSTSVSSASSHNSLSRPQSAHGVILQQQQQQPQLPTTDDFYANSSFTVAPQMQATHTRHSSVSTSYSHPSTGGVSPADSPPQPGGPGTAAPPASQAGNPTLKNHIARNTLMRVRASTSPYVRDIDPIVPVHSTSADVDQHSQQDLSNLFLPTHDYSSATATTAPPMYLPHLHQQQQPIVQSHIQGQPHVHTYPGHPHAHQPHPHFAHEPQGVFHRMAMSPHETLSHLAANVRGATTTSASDRAKQIFVQAWLNANYAPFPDGNVPRQGLYMSYRRVCDEFGIPHINTATLGKAIRLCFPTIKTRRLGVRGNSKYHYCGIRPATSSEAEWLQDYVRKSNSASAANIAAARTSGNPNGIGVGTLAGTGPGMAMGTTNMSAMRDDPRSDEEEEEDSEGAVSSDNAHSVHSHDGHRVLAHNSNKRNSLTLNNGLKSPALFAMEDKTPTVNSVMAAAQANVNGLNGLVNGGFAQMRRRHPDAAGLGGATGSSAGGAVSQGQHQYAAFGGSSAAPSIMANTVSSVRQLAGFPSIEDALDSTASSAGSTGLAAETPHTAAAREVWSYFEQHLDALLTASRAARFDQFEMHLRSFWPSLEGVAREIVHAPAVAGLMARADAVLYNEILESLRRVMLAQAQYVSGGSGSATVPGGLTPQEMTSLRGLAEKMEKILIVALEGYGTTFVEPKVELGARFGHLVLRFLDMFQVTQALTTVLMNQKQLQDMRRSWMLIDFESVRNQSALVCNCRHEDLVQLLENDFMALLNRLIGNPEPVKEVMNWADDCCERLMGGRSITGATTGEDRAPMSSRSVLIRWGYVTSQVMRDLTIRSDPVFGAFQILKLFLDDWIALNVLRSVALSTNSVAASVDPVMQEQFFALSPMAGQEGFSTNANLDVRGQGHQLMGHTPTTSSMLAALNDSFPSTGLDPSGTSGDFGSSTFSALSSYLDASPPSQSSVAGDLSGDGGRAGASSASGASLHSSLAFVADYSTPSGGFDVSGFGHDLNMTPAGSGSVDVDAVLGDDNIKAEV